jgi:hypothetical protein
LTATHKDVGLIINFGERKNGGANGHSPVLKRKVRELPENSINNQDQQDKYNPVNPVYPVKK